MSHKALNGKRAGAIFVGCLGLAVTCLADDPASGPVASGPVRVKVIDEKPNLAEATSTLPIEPGRHAQVSGQNNMMVNLRIDNKTMHLGFIQTVLKIDGQVMQPGNFPGRMIKQNQPLPQKPGSRGRAGFLSVYEVNKIQITQIVEVVPTKPPKGATKRRLNAIMVSYVVDNKDSRPHQVGVRVWMDMFLVNNDGALFAAPNKPGKILDGIELKGKDVPDYLQVLQVPNLQNPGFVAHFTYNFGRNVERIDRVVMTNLGGAFGNGWDMQIMQAMGDSAIGFYWDPKEVAPGRKRTLAYGYGEGICPGAGGEGQFNLALGGSFEPGKLFTIAAYVQDPGPGQTLTLELPAGMQRVEGKDRQPVPAMIGEDGSSMVLWKARVLHTGDFPIRVRSSAGITQTKVVSISRGDSGK
jgi:hypothetical protein